jgi:hypothetical protein
MIMDKRNAMPVIFDITAHCEPSAHFKFTRRIRNDFDVLAGEYAQSTWMLGSYGGKARLQTDVQGIGVATRMEVGRLSLRQGRRKGLVQNAFEFFREACAKGLGSGPVERILMGFPNASDRPQERELIRQAYVEAFKEECAFLSREQNLLELGHCTVFQSVVQYLREDGLYHSAHRDNIEQDQRHLHQEVGRYENHKFYVRPEKADGPVPKLDFCYTGDRADRGVEAYIEGYTEVCPEFVDPVDFRRDRSRYVRLKDYERASRRFGGLWVLQGDLVRFLSPPQIGILYLFFNEDLQPALDAYFSWEQLRALQEGSQHIDPSLRYSPTFLEVVLEGMTRGGFLVERDGAYRLSPNFAGFQHVSFYELGEYGRVNQ